MPSCQVSVGDFGVPSTFFSRKNWKRFKKHQNKNHKFDIDEHPKAGMTIERLVKLSPAFKRDGTVTAGNSSGINDGAAAVVLMSQEEANKRNLEPLAKIVSWATCGVDPSLMGLGPIPASKKALEKIGWRVKDLDLIEMVEVIDHPWFVGVQFHPELKSRVVDVHPLFRDFVSAAKKYKGNGSRSKS